jgi:hypothetical protein
MKQLRIGSVALAVLGLVAACTPEVRELGDEPVAGSAGDAVSGGTGNAGAGASTPRGGSGTGGVTHTGGVTQTGGTTHTGAATHTGAVAGEGGAPSQECFAPTINLELAQQEGALGCECESSDPVCVSDLQADPPWIGMLNCEGGRWRSVPPSCDTQCFSPDSSPELAVDQPDAGCPCHGDEPAECVQTEYDGRPWRVALYCEQGRWISAEDGVCGDGRQSDCRVGDVTYPHGGRNIPDPFGCGVCACDDGALTECSGVDCVVHCAEGEFPARRCLDCGPVDECTVTEIGCLSGDGCETGVCVGAMCG